MWLLLSFSTKRIFIYFKNIIFDIVFFLILIRTLDVNRQLPCGTLAVRQIRRLVRQCWIPTYYYSIKINYRSLRVIDRKTTLPKNLSKELLQDFRSIDGSHKSDPQSAMHFEIRRVQRLWILEEAWRFSNSEANRKRFLLCYRQLMVEPFGLNLKS